jgi:UDP-N-acetylglucosamine 4,6-dehydratase
LFEILKIIDREQELFLSDIEKNKQNIKDLITKSSILVIGGAGSIGQATVKELLHYNPERLYVVDLSENNLAELVRDVRSSIGYINGDFQTFAIDSTSVEFNCFFGSSGPFDFVLNLSALKHVRSEKDPFTLMRMLHVNTVSIAETLQKSLEKGAKKYFAVSTDKAANPVNLMGATKRLMEHILFSYREDIAVSSARFANVAFSDGSLLHGFNMRIMKKQPIAAPADVKRYFVTPEESGRLCMLSALLGKNREIYFPKLDTNLHLIDFSQIALRYLESRGLEPYICKSEDEARSMIHELQGTNKWPCLFSESNTTGEKAYEEFYTDSEKLDLEQFLEIGIILGDYYDRGIIESYIDKFKEMRTKGRWSKVDLLCLVKDIVPELEHEEKGFYLDGKM